MIEIKLTFANALQASVALAKIGEGQALLAEIGGAAGADATDKGDKGGKGGRPTKEEKAAKELAEKEAAAKAKALDDDDVFGPGAGTPAKPDYAAQLIAFQTANPGKTDVEFVRSHVQSYIDKFGADETKKFMGAFGHPKMSQVPAEKYPALVEQITAKLAA